jgi:hypothetical protein
MGLLVAVDGIGDVVIVHTREAAPDGARHVSQDPEPYAPGRRQRSLCSERVVGHRCMPDELPKCPGPPYGGRQQPYGVRAQAPRHGEHEVGVLEMRRRQTHGAMGGRVHAEGGERRGRPRVDRSTLGSDKAGAPYEDAIGSESPAQQQLRSRAPAQVASAYDEDSKRLAVRR